MFRVKPFNLIYCLMILFFVLVGLVLHFTLRNKSVKTRRDALIYISIFNILLYVGYKFALYIGDSYIREHDFKFDWLTELPFQMCNITLFLIPIGLIKRRGCYLGYAFYLTMLGAFFAILLPPECFLNNSIFSVATIGYYATHAIIIINSALIVSLDLFKPSFKAFPSVLLTFLMLGSSAHIINLLINNLTGHPANYFYTMNTDGNALLEIAWKIIPYRYLYLYPTLIVFSSVMILETLPFMIHKYRKDKKDEKKNSCN